MKVFLSYGHDQNEPLVTQISRDLKAAGHTVWIDTADIKTGDDWRRSIVDGLSDSDWTLGVLSRHAIRDPGVCLDELGIALHVKHGTIATILVESAQDVAPPISISHIQWLDMHDWAARRAVGSAAWEHWYQGKIAEILALLADPAALRFAGEIEELERLLKPITQEADIGLLVDGFVGRAWLAERLEVWRRTALQSRLFWVSGAPGSGKSAFAAWLAHRGKANVLGLNMCRYNAEDRRDPGRVLRTLAFQIATRLPDYRRLLLDRLKRQDPGGVELARKSVAALFDWLLAEPLRYGIDGSRSEDRHLVVIDALDETIRDGRSELAEVLAESVAKLPQWMAIVVTSRPELPILRQFAAFQPQRIEAESPENLADLQRFARLWIDALPHPPLDTDQLITRVVAASDGNFLYLRTLQDAVSAGLLDISEPGLPCGLVGLYERWFRRQFPDQTAYENVVPVLEVLVAAQRPVPEMWLTRIFGWSKREGARVLATLGSLFERRVDGIAPFHKSLRDWLVDEQSSGADFVVDVAPGIKRLAFVLWGAFLEWSNDPSQGPLDDFCTHELPRQILMATPNDVQALSAAGRPWPTVWDAFCKVADHLSDGFAWDAALAWWRTAALLSDRAGEAARLQRFYALRAAGDTLRTLGRRTEAREAYDACLAVARILHDENRVDVEACRALFIADIRVGNMLMVDGAFVDAVDAYGEANRLVRDLVECHPKNIDLRRDLFVGLERVGDALAAHGEKGRALEFYEEASTVIRVVLDSDPTRQSRQRDAAVIESKIADILVDDGHALGALGRYREALAIMRRLCAEQGAHALWQRDIFAHLTRIGDVLLSQGDLDAAADAYEEGLLTVRKLSARDPSNVELRRDIHVSLVKRCDVLLAHKDTARAIDSARESLTTARTLAKMDAENAQWRGDVLVSLMKLGDSLEAQTDCPAAIEAFQESLSIAQDLSKTDLAGSRHQIDTVLLLWRLADLGVNPHQYWSDALAIIMKLKTQNRLAADQGDWIRQIQGKLDRLD